MIVKRQSNFELLRIISMFMIILHHFSVHSTWCFTSEISSSRVVLQFFALFGKIGVNCFILISAYFLSVNTFKIKTLKQTGILTIFYSVLFTLIHFIVNHSFNIKIFVRSFFPLTYWFVSAYVLLYLFVPFLNAAINSLSKKQLEKYLFICFISFSFIQNIIPSYKILSNNFVWFLFLYIIGAYIRLYFNFNAPRIYAFIFLAGISISIVGIIICDWLSKNSSFFNRIDTLLVNSQGMIQLILSVLLFLYFKNLKMPYNKIINTISATTFGVYLIHDHPYVRQFIWQHIDKFVNPENPIQLLIIGIFSTIAIFTFCTIIELIRKSVGNFLCRFNKRNLSKSS